MSLLSPQQARFVSTLSSETGLNPRVVGAWALAEQSGGAAKNYESRGINNWLNVGNVDSDPSAGNKFKVWSDPVKAAQATAAWLRGQGSLAHEYGAPALGIQAILHTSHLGPTSQISAIAHSGWASSGYDGGATLQALYGQLGGEKIPPPGESVTPTGFPKGVQTNPSVAPSFNQGGYEKAQRVAAANRILTEGSGGSILRGILPTSVSPKNFGSSTAATRTIEQLPGNPQVKGQYGSPSAAVKDAERSIGHDAESEGQNLGPELDKLEKSFGMTGEPWCAMAATTFVHAGGSPATRTASVALINQWANEGSHGYERGTQTASPGNVKPGDLLTFGNAHVAFVKAVTAHSIITIEGNANGSGGVVQLEHPYGTAKVVRPKYD